jgi:hypothetical protein
MADETAADDGSNSDDTGGDSSGDGNRDDDVVATADEAALPEDVGVVEGAEAPAQKRKYQTVNKDKK